VSKIREVLRGGDEKGRGKGDGVGARERGGGGREG